MVRWSRRSQGATVTRCWVVSLVMAALTLASCSSTDVGSVPSVTPVEAPGWRVPAVGASWQVQYTGTPDPGEASVIDVDWEDTSAAFVEQVHARGGYAICYLNAGAWEDWRGDADSYPSPLLGSPMATWEGERWVNIADLDALMPVLVRRLDVCAAKGFDAVDPDNVDGWQARTGFAITASDAAALVTALSRAAHQRGLAMGLKNAPELIPDVLTEVDFAVNEQCAQQGSCADYRQVLAADKAVFNVEYAGTPASVCGRTLPGFSTIIKDPALGPGGLRCP